MKLSLWRYGAVALCLVLFTGSRATAADTELVDEVGRLRAEVDSLRGELESLRGETMRLPPVDQTSTLAMPVLMSPSGRLIVEEASDAEFEYENIVPEPAPSHDWCVGPFRLTPYGVFWGDIIYASDRTNTGAFPLYVFSRDQQGEAAFTVDIRRSRFGFNVAGPPVGLLGDAQSGGKLEIDFHGSFVTENKASVLLRHAYWEVKDDYYRLLIGQTWDVISPLNPGTLNYSVGWNGGNIGYRRAQFRFERYWYPADDVRLALQASVNQDIVTDFPTDPGIRRDSANWPVVEARWETMWRRCDECLDPVTLGFSGHVGETGFDFLTAGPGPLNLPPEDDARFFSWSFNVDMRVPITQNFGVQGEFFTGANLSTFLGGIGQGVCPCLRVPIRSTGGWLELWYDWTPCFHTHVGFGIDDPRNNDSLLGRVYNQFIFANFSYDLSDHLTTGIEVTAWKTLYHEERVGQIPDDELTPSAPGKAVTVEWMVKYDF